MKLSFIAYKGEVPMSPKTTPIAPSISVGNAWPLSEVEGELPFNDGVLIVVSITRLCDQTTLKFHVDFGT